VRQYLILPRSAPPSVSADATHTSIFECHMTLLVLTAPHGNSRLSRDLKVELAALPLFHRYSHHINHVAVQDEIL